MSITLAPEEIAAASAAFGASDVVQIKGWQARIGVRPDGQPGEITTKTLRRLAGLPVEVDTTPAPRGLISAADSPVYSLRGHGPDFKLSPNFTLVEMASKDGADKVLAHPALIQGILEPVRAHFDAPVTINSGYRSPRHNRKIGGAIYSRHPMGLAADIAVRGVSADKVADFVATLNPGGLGLYRSFTHVDVQGNGRRWDNR